MLACRSVVLVSSLYDELFPHFRSSTLAHVGLDETVDIGTSDTCHQYHSLSLSMICVAIAMPLVSCLVLVFCHWLFYVAT